MEIRDSGFAFQTGLHALISISRKLGPFLILALGGLITIIWIVALTWMTWIPMRSIMSTIVFSAIELLQNNI